MRLIVQFAIALRNALSKRSGHGDTAASRLELETAIGDAVSMDADVLLSLTPDSVSTMLMVGDIDASVAEYIVHALMLDSAYLSEDGYDELATLRRQQAEAVGRTFGVVYDPGRLGVLLEPAGTLGSGEQGRLESR